MNKIIGLLLVSLSLLTSALVISLGQVSKAIKESQMANFSASTASGEIPMHVYLIIIIVVCLGIYLMNSKDKH